MNVLLTLSIAATLALFFGVLRLKNLVTPVIVIGLLASLVFNAMEWNNTTSIFNDMMLYNNYTVAFASVGLFITLILVLFYSELSAKHEFHLPEILAIMLFGTVGGIVLLSFRNMVMLFLGIEILSLSYYVLAGIRKQNVYSNEASLKYFLMGAFSSGFLLMGIALIYGVTASLNLNEIAGYVNNTKGIVPPYFLVGVLLILSALLFKVAAAPFHFWTPDVYDGAPTLITALMSSVGKLYSFGAFVLLFNSCFIPLIADWEVILWIAALLSMSVGNITALYQKSVKRMLAYSSIAHAGYMLLALVGINNLTSGSVLFYALAYALASVVSFVVLYIVRDKKGSYDIASFNGLAQKNRMLAVVFTISMLSLTGIPLTAGFFGKFYIFNSALQSGYYWLTAFAVINSFIGAYYYLKPVVAMFASKSDEEITMPALSNSLLILLGILIILIGALPGFISGVI
jgi:NADH-quinone oxidoreductase subunit N